MPLPWLEPPEPVRKLSRPGSSGFVPTLTGLLLGAGFALSFGVQQAVAAQFHEVAFAVPLLTVSLGYLVLASRVSGDERNRYLARACWWALPSPSSRRIWA